MCVHYLGTTFFSFYYIILYFTASYYIILLCFLNFYLWSTNNPTQKRKRYPCKDNIKQPNEDKF